MMDLDFSLITAVATVIGVIGGLISVIFLVYEIRRNALAIEGSTVQSLMSLEAQIFATILTHAALYLRGCVKSPDLTEAEAFQFEVLVGGIMSLTYSAYVQHQQGLIDQEVWQAYVNAINGRLSNRGFLECWRSIQTSYPQTFQMAIDQILPVTVLPSA